MAAEEVLKLFDSHWFGLETSTTTTTPPPQEPNPFLEAQEQIKKPNPFLEVQEQIKKPNLCNLPTLHVRSQSDHSLFSKTSSGSFTSDQYSFSPNSVLITTPRLQTIVSGKVMKEELPEEAPAGKNKVAMSHDNPKGSRMRSARRKKKVSKSLSELEFDELKGFMDLGFVFSEEDKDSSLVSIIPGLQRFGSREDVKDVKKVDDDDDDHVGVSRPYLSEAWEVLEQREKEKALMMNLRVPAVGNEMDMKDHLKFWAHTVASTVR